MGSELPVQLTESELVSVREYLDECRPKTRRTARSLLLKGGVRILGMSADRSIVSATVLDGKRHEVECRFEDECLVETGCSCSDELDCKHTLAVLEQLAAAGGRPDLPGAYKVTLGSGASVYISPGGKASIAPGEPPKVEAGGFAREVASRTGQTLPAKAIAFLNALDRWWGQDKRVVSEGDLRIALGLPDLWARADTVLYPKGHRPADAWEFLHLAAYVVRKLRLSLPQPLEQSLDADLQSRLVARWEREDMERGWVKTVRDWELAAQALEEDAAAALPRFRLRLTSQGGLVECLEPGAPEFGPAKSAIVRQWCADAFTHGARRAAALRSHDRIVLGAAMVGGSYFASQAPVAGSDDFQKAVLRLLEDGGCQDALVGEDGAPLPRHEEPLTWRLREDANEHGDYELGLCDSAGSAPPPPLFVRGGVARFYVTPHGVWQVRAWPFEECCQWPKVIPSKALESPEGLAILDRLGVPLPARIASRVVVLTPRITVRCQLWNGGLPSDYLHVRTEADFGPGAPLEKWHGRGWMAAGRRDQESAGPPGKKIVRKDRSALNAASEWLAGARLAMNPYQEVWERRVTKEFPEEFLAWIARTPEGVALDLDADLASLRDGRISAIVKLEVEESSIDWFDLKVSLDVSDTTLTKEELDTLLNAKGRWIRLPGKGWRRLEYQVTPADEEALADMGLAVADFDGKPQRLHALQLAPAASGTRMLTEERAAEVRRRVEEIQTRVAPSVPVAITATMRPYQEEGFHFLAYLTANRFGGVLADDMGLGKTLQTLAWLAWLRTRGPEDDAARPRAPALVVCPKSVQDNWLSEAARFLPGLKVEVWSRATAGSPVAEDCDLLVIHYQQLRHHEAMLSARAWSAVILDEAQAIKNPSSQSATAACKLRADHRLALTGTPIENRLLDLWSIMAFAMPGVLGARAAFSRHFDAKGDPFARRRLAARVRPFLLRRTKKEVARDLPERIEEDFSCELDGVQERLYRAELKRARAQLLKLKTAKELDKARFNILTSLLRLRQICCHPRLAGCAEESATSAKLEALLELLDPLMQEGHKVLVFSQFVDMLHLIRDEVERSQWPAFLLTGETEERGALVERFQNHDGAAVFLISLKAGGFGLNLTAASYVVLFDPWWNPAVEAQAIDRAHRIGQQRTVIAYRLLMKETIEEKIRMLQKQKGALASDILGEESFAKALTLDDFKFLLGEEK